MTRREWKRVILGGLAISLEAELDNGSEWLFTDRSGEPLEPDDEERMRAAVLEVVDSLLKRGAPRPAPDSAKEGQP